MLTTTQQTSLALGVALLGSLFVSLATTARLGPLHAAVTILTIQAVVAAGLAAGSRLLPRGGRAAGPVLAQRESVALDPAA